jgi:hypothetical protein
MAMANIAVLMAQRGLKVLAVDWDLEAPGLERYFSSFEQSPSPGGLLPFFTEVYGKLGTNEPLISYQNHIWNIRVDDKHSFALFPSGRDTHSSYATMLEQFNWRRFFSEGGGDFIERLRVEWLEKFDFVLIDSRTGMSDAGGICTIQMPDVLVAMFTANEQSMLGVFDIIQAAQRGRQRLAYDRMPLTILPVACRFASFTEFEKSSLWLDRFAEQFSGICDDWLLPWIPLRAMFERIKIPQVDWFGFGERLAVVEQGVSDPSSMGFALDRITDLLASDFNDLEAALGRIARQPPDWKRQKEAERPRKITSDEAAYEYDLFVSYHHGGVVTEWVRAFVDNLVDWLSMELPYKPRVFLDYRDADIGESFNAQLEKALERSKLLLAILTPAYFASDWCRREWAIFEKRELITKSGPMILPVLLRGRQILPDIAKRRQWIDASDIDIIGKNQKASKNEYVLLKETAKSIAMMLENVAPYDPHLDIAPDDEVLAELSLAPAKSSPLNKDDHIKHAVLKKILADEIWQPSGRSKFEAKGKIIHMRYCSPRRAGNPEYKFSINPNTLSADYEVWICGDENYYYLLPKDVIERMYNDPEAYVDRRHPEIRVVSVNASTDSATYARGGKKVDLGPYVGGAL